MPYGDDMHKKYVHAIYIYIYVYIHIYIYVYICIVWIMKITTIGGPGPLQLPAGQRKILSFLCQNLGHSDATSHLNPATSK